MAKWCADLARMAWSRANSSGRHANGVAADGAVYGGEVYTGRRVQKFERIQE
ncbi:MAG: hypothetical protein HND44_19265 [Chloroflexi bacterium]|nr:hypothetical protein [Chloroflexota bacterium]